MTVQQVFDFINARAPFETQEDFDNAGLLVGDPEWEVSGIHVALDITNAVIDEAIARGANLIVTHHPMMFAPRKRMVENEHEARLLCRMIRRRIALIAAHTNLDQACGGINDTLAETLGLQDIVGEGFLRVGNLPEAMTAEDFARHTQERLHTVVRLMGDGAHPVRRVGMCSGAGSDFWRDAAALGADAFISGEVKHHHALEAVEAGVVLLEAGHFATEQPGIFALADALQKWLNEVQYEVVVSKSGTQPYGCPV